MGRPCAPNCCAKSGKWAGSHGSVAFFPHHLPCKEERRKRPLQAPHSLHTPHSLKSWLDTARDRVREGSLYYDFNLMHPHRLLSRLLGFQLVCYFGKFC